MRKYFFTGLIIFLPIVLTLLIVIFVFDILTNPFIGVIDYFLGQFSVDPSHHATIFFLSRIIVLICLVLFIFLLGFIAQMFLTRWFLSLMDRLFRKIPIIKSIYRISVEITNSFFQTTEKPFKKTVLMKFPHQKAHAYAFLTGKAPKEIQEKESSEEEMKTVFLPTAPHPISGFMLIVQESLLTDVDISVEDIFKTLVSCGLYVPGETESGHETKKQQKSDLSSDKKEK